MRMWKLALLLGLSLLAPVFAKDPVEESSTASLKVGDLAPALAPGKWIKGEPVTSFETGKVYVVEFWATWCPPCRLSIPHLTELQKKHPEVVIIGQNCMEKDAGEVAKFVEAQGDAMKYRVALDQTKGDGGQGVMETTWLEAADANGIPTAFVVGKDRRIIWIGHPLELDQVLEQLVAGTFDPTAVAKLREKIEALSETFSAAMEDKKWDKALATLDELAKAMPGSAEGVAEARFFVLVAKQDFDAIQKMAVNVLESKSEDFELLNSIAWTLVSSKGLKNPDLALAEKLAMAASAAAHGENPEILDTLARVQFMAGKKKEAIATQQKALKLVEDDDAKKEFRETLESYEAGKLPEVHDLQDDMGLGDPEGTAAP